VSFVKLFFDFPATLTSDKSTTADAISSAYSIERISFLFPWLNLNSFNEIDLFFNILCKQHLE